MNQKSEDKIRALALISGGLDSSLSVALCQSLGIEVIGLHFKNIFHPGKRNTGRAAENSAEALGIELVIRDSTPMLMQAIRNPKFGFGRHLNPCMDCREYMLGQAKAMLEELDAKFIISGEVLGQRPMSQRSDAIKRIDEEAGVVDLVLRPLCARNFPESLPEREGWVDREQLLGIKGRSRKEQYALARKLGVTVFSSPAGGCLLTDPGFSSRLEEMMDFNPDFDENDVELLKFGRHFRLSPSTRAIVGRDLEDNTSIEELVREGDLLVEVTAGGSPTTLLRSNPTEKEIEKAAALTARYSRSRDQASVEVSCWKPSAGQTRDDAENISVTPIDEDGADALAIGRVGE